MQIKWVLIYFGMCLFAIYDWVVWSEFIASSLLIFFVILYRVKGVNKNGSRKDRQ